MKQIPLTQGQVAIVDDDDFEWLMQHKWYARENSYEFYAMRNVRRDNGKRTSLYMHRAILQEHGDDLDGLLVDHASGNTLDNRKCNIRTATRSQNAQNSPRHKVGISGYRGVKKDRTRWRASIKVNDRRVYLGLFPTPIEAALARDRAAIEHHGEFAILNFTDEAR